MGVPGSPMPFPIDVANFAIMFVMALVHVRVLVLSVLNSQRGQNPAGCVKGGMSGFPVRPRYKCQLNPNGPKGCGEVSFSHF